MTNINKLLYSARGNRMLGMTEDSVVNEFLDVLLPGLLRREYVISAKDGDYEYRTKCYACGNDIANKMQKNDCACIHLVKDIYAGRQASLAGLAVTIFRGELTCLKLGSLGTSTESSPCTSKRDSLPFCGFPSFSEHGECYSCLEYLDGLFKGNGNDCATSYDEFQRQLKPEQYSYVGKCSIIRLAYAVGVLPRMIREEENLDE